MLSQWFLVGAGRCGLQLARALRAAGFTIAGVEIRSAEGRRRLRRALPGVPAITADDPLPAAAGVLIAIPDSAIPACAEALAPRLRPATRVVLHTSGLLASDALAPIARRGPSTASLHPLAVFSSATGPLVPLRGVVAGIEGEARAAREARRLAAALGMRPVSLRAAVKPAYHAAAALAANLTHVLVAEARDTLIAAGLSRRAATAALQPLAGSAVATALSARGLERLTGPVARGDAAAVLTHIEALPAEAAAAYRAVAALALSRLARQRLLATPQCRELAAALTGRGRCARFRPSS